MIDLTGIKTLADVPRAQAHWRGNAQAILFEGRGTTFAELDAQATKIANRLIADGIKPQERVAILAKNNDHFFALWLGCCKARVCLTPLNFRLAPPEIAFVLGDSQAKAVIVGQDFIELTERAIADLPNKPKLIALDFEKAGYEPYAAWANQGSTRDPMLEGAMDDDVIQLYTSGTTGNPKGVQLTNENYIGIFGLAKDITGFNYGVGETVMEAMPQFHVAGTNIGMIAIASGARMVIVKDLIPAVVLDLLQKEKVNHCFFVPAVILMLMQAPEMANADLTNLKSLSYGASPIAEDLLTRAKERFNCSFIQLYGMTETTGAGTYLPDSVHVAGSNKLRSCGIAWPGIGVKIVDDQGNEVKRGDVGEVVIKAPIVMKGYYNKPDATKDSIRDGWMHTGDAAYMDEEGYVFIYDRLKDMIVSGGENIYPAEVENAIFGHPDVADCAVIGVPDDKWGEAVKAVVITKPGAPQDAAAIIAWARERVAGYKAPKSVDFVTEIPRNPSGKILRRELRKPYWEGRTRMVS